MGKLLTTGWLWFCELVQDELCPSLPQWMGLLLTAGLLAIGVWQALVLGALWPLGAGVTFAVIPLALAWPCPDDPD